MILAILEELNVTLPDDLVEDMIDKVFQFVNQSSCSIRSMAVYIN